MAMRRLCEAVLYGMSFSVFGDGLQSREFTYIRDACDATIRAALADGHNPVYNIGAAQKARSPTSSRLSNDSLVPGSSRCAFPHGSGMCDGLRLTRPPPGRGSDGGPA
ncbi:MAG: NAD-dependent epimerase/dehydratase family protein [Arthrobacter sp.]